MEEPKRHKLFEFIKRHDNISILILTIIMITGFCFDVVIESGDELWNFQNICKMLNGYKIYTDANVIITPIFYFIGFIMLKILGTNLFIFRIYNILILTLCSMLTYLVLKELCKNKFISFIYFSIIIAELISLCAGGANYNILAIGFVLLGIYINLKWLKNRQINNIIQATMMFIVFFTKQNIGIYYIIGIIIYQLIIYKDVKSIIRQALIGFIETITLMFIFYKTGILYDFIDYAVLGIKEFSNNNLGGSLVDLIKTGCWFTLVIVISIVFKKSKDIDKIHKQYACLLICLSIPMLLISYPIYNEYHGIISRIVLTILILYTIYIIALKDFLDDLKIKKILYIISIFIIILFSIRSFICFGEWYYKVNYSTDFKYSYCYYGGFFESEEEYNKWFDTINYIKKQDKRVIILSKEAALYMIPLKQNNGAMDLPFYGNMGKNGEKKMIDKIAHLSDVQILILDNGEKLFWQESEKINNYVKENFNYVGRIQDFTIFEK